MANKREQAIEKIAIITPQESIRMIEAFLTAFHKEKRKGIATQIYNAMLVIGYVLKDTDQSLPNCVLYKFQGYEKMIMGHDCPLLRAGWVKVLKE